jgi:hypothetical protein
MHSPSDHLPRLHIRLAESIEDRQRWDQIMAQEHYLHSARMMGQQLRYVAEADGQWLGLLGWSSATLSSALRRRWIGWTLGQERQRLHLIAHNARFLIRGDRRIPNLASHVLGACTRHLRRDWRAVYGHEPLLAETFVDEQRFRGNCYRAAGWTAIGTTRGHRKLRVGFHAHGEPKLLLMKELVPRARVVLCGASHADDRDAFLTIHEIRLTGEDGLLAHLRKHLREPRGRKGRMFQLITVLGITAVGMLTGRGTMEEIGRWAEGLDQATLELFHCPQGGDGRWKPPCANSLRYLMKDIDMADFHQALRAWLERQKLLPQGLERLPWRLRWTRQRRRCTATAPDPEVVGAAVSAGACTEAL